MRLQDNTLLNTIQTYKITSIVYHAYTFHASCHFLQKPKKGVTQEKLRL